MADRTSGRSRNRGHGPAAWSTFRVRESVHAWWRAAEPGLDDSDPAAVLGAIRRWKDRFR